jgi:hypothetical protein
MTIEIIIVHPPDYNEQANLPVVSLLSLRKKDGLSMGFKHNRVLTRSTLGSWAVNRLLVSKYLICW